MTDALTEVACRRVPSFPGICVGMQLLASRGLEYEVVEGLDWIGGDVVQIEPSDAAQGAPHGLEYHSTRVGRIPLLQDLPLGETGLHAYFVHSYRLPADQSDAIIAEVDYGGPVTAMVGRDNIAARSSIPSQSLGLRLIGNSSGGRLDPVSGH